jgi:hypothetical protein
MPEIEEMDLEELHCLQFCVAINTGHRDDHLFLCKTIHGPYSFDDMVGEVSRMLNDDGNNAKVIVLDNNPKSRIKTLDCKTTEYIQFRAGDILMERLLCSQPKEFTCKASILEEIQEDKKGEDE